MARPRWRAARKVSFIAFKLTFRNVSFSRRKSLFETKVFRVHEKQTFQLGSLAVCYSNPKQTFCTIVYLFPYLKQTFLKQTFSQKQTDKLVEKRFVFERFKLVPTEFVLSFQFQTNVSKKVCFEPWNLRFRKGNVSFWNKTFVFSFHCFQSKAWAAPQR